MATVTRVLPWRRHADPAAVQVAPLVAAFRSHHGHKPDDRIERAYRLASEAHEGQFRKSGEPYVHHPLAVAHIVAQLGLDETTIAAALLHDSVEDTGIELDDLRRQFGDDLAEIVDGVTKLERVKFDTKEAQQAATMRKMLVAMAKDLRVIIIKLADRLHNLRTIAALPDWKQARTAHETLDVYAPLAHRLGMQEMKTQLEDLSFAALHPKRYAEIDHMIQTRSPERDLYVEQVVGIVQERLAQSNVDAEVTGRPKHLWSIYEKMVVKGRAFDDIFDLVGIRIIVSNLHGCYGALGAIHGLWKPVQGRFKDYIAHPKFNLYQSLHTTVVGPQGKPLEVQIRTSEMHGRAEFGVASHYAYKDSDVTADGTWFDRILEWESETEDPGHFMANLKLDLDQDEVFVFTPKGEVVTLPVGSTPIDFAYTIHTEVGHACIGARVNGRLVPLETELASGDTVEIFTAKGHAGGGPSRDWLDMVATHRAANKIKQWFSRERREDMVAAGRDDVIKAIRREGLPVQRITKGPMMADLAEGLNYADVEALFAAVGERHVSANSVAARAAKALRGGEDGSEEQIPTTARSPRKGRRTRATTHGVHVEGLDDLLVRLSKCCTPVPGDEIIGFVTRGRGVSVHRADCANAVSLSDGQADRVIDVEWDDDSEGTFVASIEIKALDRSGLLGDVTTTLTDHHVNIVAANTATGGDRVSTMRFEFELGDPGHLDSLIAAVKGIESVYDAYRVVPGKGG